MSSPRTNGNGRGSGSVLQTTISNLASSHHPFIIGLLIRFLLAWLLPMLLDDNDVILPGVQYTDIDYYVFTDAAAHIQQGQGPFDRTTYRYTPFLAQFLAILPYMRITSRYVFCFADAVCGAILCTLRRQERQLRQEPGQQRQKLSTTLQQQSASTHTLHSVEKGNLAPSLGGAEGLMSSPWWRRNNDSASLAWNSNLVDALWWQYNPLAIYTCTRGSAESFIVLLPVLLTLWAATATLRGTRKTNFSPLYFWWTRPVLTGLAHGLAMHCKVYPVIYSAALAAIMCEFPTTNLGHGGGNTVSFFTWLRILLSTPAALLFGVVALGTFGGLTAAAVYQYGHVALDEGLLYHFSRVDHRHNYSLHWYWIYLSRWAVVAEEEEAHALDAVEGLVSPTTVLAWCGRLLLLPQALFLLVASWRILVASSSSIGSTSTAAFSTTIKATTPPPPQPPRPQPPTAQALYTCVFLQTLAFVAQNKVITAQYFSWYTCLLPLATQHVQFDNQLVRAIVLLIVSIVTWLGTAYWLELQGGAVHLYLWMASMFFYVAHMNVLRAFLYATLDNRPRNQDVSVEMMKEKVA